MTVLAICVVVWEYPCTPEQGNDFLALIAAIRIHLPEEHYLLTAALPAAKPILQNINLQQAADYLDTLNLMAYDFYGQWTHKSGHHAQLYATTKGEPSGDSGVQHLMSSGVPGKKILLGIPLFGRSFLHVAGPGHKNRGSGGNDGSFEYKHLPRKGTKEQVDKRAIAAQCVGGDGGFVTYDNPDTVTVKAGFCKQKGLGVRSARGSSPVPLRHVHLLHSSSVLMTPPADKILFDTGTVLLERTVRRQGQQTKPHHDGLQDVAQLLMGLASLVQSGQSLGFASFLSLSPLYFSLHNFNWLKRLQARDAVDDEAHPWHPPRGVGLPNRGLGRVFRGVIRVVFLLSPPARLV